MCVILVVWVNLIFKELQAGCYILFILNIFLHYVAIFCYGCEIVLWNKFAIIVYQNVNNRNCSEFVDPRFLNAVTQLCLVSYTMTHMNDNRTWKMVWFVFFAVWHAVCIWLKRSQHCVVGPLWCAEWWHRGSISYVTKCPQGLDLETGLLWRHNIFMFLWFNLKILALYSQSPITICLPVSMVHISVTSALGNMDGIFCDFYCSFWKLFLSSLYWITKGKR